MKIIAFSGKKQSGKTTAGNDIEKRSCACVQINFADDLKKIVGHCFGATHKNLQGSDEDKNKILACGKTSREVLQIVGTDWFRSLDPDCWVNAYKVGVKKLKDGFDDISEGSFDEGLIITSDVRFPNEVKCIQELGGHVIRLLRNPHDDQHESETALDAIEYDTGNVLAHPDKDFPEMTLFDAVLDNREMTIEQQNEAIWKLINERGWLNE